MVSETDPEFKTKAKKGKKKVDEEVQTEFGTVDAGVAK